MNVNKGHVDILYIAIHRGIQYHQHFAQGDIAFEILRHLC